MTIRGREVAEVGAVEAVTQGEAGDGASAEVEISQLHQLANTTAGKS